MAVEPEELTVADPDAWRDWLREHHATSPGVWLVLAKTGTTEPTCLRYDQALEEALCHGWIDGQARRREDTTYLQRFTPRRARSTWSTRNTRIIERLLAEGRMRPAGIAEVERAKADGRWESAYDGPATMAVPADLTAALAAEPKAQAMVRHPHQPQPLCHPAPDHHRQTSRDPDSAHRAVRRDARPWRDAVSATSNAGRVTERHYPRGPEWQASGYHPLASCHLRSHASTFRNARATERAISGVRSGQGRM